MVLQVLLFHIVLQAVSEPCVPALRVLFPPVSLQRQVVCLLLWPVLCSSQGRAYTVSWLVQIKIML